MSPDPVAPFPTPAPGGPSPVGSFFADLPGHFVRAARPRWAEGVARPAERERLAVSPEGAVTGGQAQDFMAWRRSMVTVAFSLLAVATAFGFVTWCIELADRIPNEQIEKVFHRTFASLLSLAQVGSYAFMGWMAWLAMRRWSDLRRSHRLMRWGWFVGYATPFALALFPPSAFFSFGDIPGANQADVESALATIGMLFGITYFIQLLPTVLSVLVGAIRSSVMVKRYAPESAVPGWIAAAVSPVFSLLLLTIFILFHQMSGNVLLIVGIGLLTLDYLQYLMQAGRIARPIAPADLRAAMAPLVLRTTLLGWGGIVFLGVGVFTMKMGNSYFVGFGDEHMMSPLKLLGLVVEFAGKAVFTALLFSDLLVALLRHAWSEAQAFRQNELSGVLEHKLSQMDAAGIRDIRVRVGGTKPPAQAPAA